MHTNSEPVVVVIVSDDDECQHVVSQHAAEQEPEVQEQKTSADCRDDGNSGDLRHEQETAGLQEQEETDMNNRDDGDGDMEQKPGMREQGQGEDSGHRDGPHNGKTVLFKPVDDVFAIITNGSDTVITEVPRGQKSNVAFLVDNSANVERMRAGAHSIFWDDCGVWQSGGPVCRRTFVVKDGHLVGVKAVNGNYCVRKKMIDKRRMWVPLQVQPLPQNVVTVRQMYAHHNFTRSFLITVSACLGWNRTLLLPCTSIRVRRLRS